MFKPDPVLGWAPKAGHHLSPAYTEGEDPIQYHFLDDGSRATSGNIHPSNYDIILVGDSFTQGWAVSDDETFGWKIQTHFSERSVGNFGRGSYGTYQSLLLLRQLFDRELKPGLVIYGFNPFHEPRNAASPHWLKLLTSYSKRGMIGLPYCSLNRQGRLVEHPAIQWPTFAMQEYFALPQLLIAAYFKLRNGIDDELTYPKNVTRKLMLEMRDLTDAHGADLIVVILSGDEPDVTDYSRYLREHDIEVIDARIQLTDEYRVSGDGHPNERAHSRWADEIIKYIKAHNHVSKSN